MVHFVLQQRRVVVQKKTTSWFEEKSQTIEKGKNHSIYGISVLNPYCLIKLTKKSFSFLIFTLSVHSKATRFLSPQQWFLDQIQFFWL